MTDHHAIRKTTPEPPRGLERWTWYGPRLLWMLSSVGSGSVLFTPRVGAQYGYDLLWIALIVLYFQWVMIREVGRYTVATGRTLLAGYGHLPGPKGWAIWLIFVPQLVAATVTIAGIAALAGSAMMIALPGSQVIYASGIILISISLVLSGKYEGVEKVSSLLAITLSLAAIVSAAVVFPNVGALGSGAIPVVPDNFDLYFILPWVGRPPPQGYSSSASHSCTSQAFLGSKSRRAARTGRFDTGVSRPLQLEISWNFFE